MRLPSHDPEIIELMDRTGFRPVTEGTTLLGETVRLPWRNAFVGPADRIPDGWHERPWPTEGEVLIVPFAPFSRTDIGLSINSLPNAETRRHLAADS